MQLAGKTCKACDQSILLDADGNWCARCNSVFHRTCLENSDGICPVCKKQFQPPDTVVFRSEFCPECLAPNTPPQDRCSKCRAATSWDNRDAYDEFKQHLADESKLCLARGCGELIIGLFCLSIVLAKFVFFQSFGFFPLVLPIIGFLLLTSDGLKQFQKARRFSKFR